MTQSLPGERRVVKSRGLVAVPAVDSVSPVRRYGEADSSHKIFIPFVLEPIASVDIFKLLGIEKVFRVDERGATVNSGSSVDDAFDVALEFVLLPDVVQVTLPIQRVRGHQAVIFRLTVCLTFVRLFPRLRMGL